jgi:hypothetical protein
MVNRSLAASIQTLNKSAANSPAKPACVGGFQRRGRFCFLLTLLLCLFAGTFSTHAQSTSSDVSIRKLGVNWKDETPYLSFSARDFFNSNLNKQLQSGLPQTIVTTLTGYSENSQTPVVVSIRSCRIIYDLWEEIYRVQIKTENRTTHQSIGSLETVQRVCLVFLNEKIGQPELYRPLKKKFITFAVTVELNAISDKTIESIRRWLAHSEEGSKLTGGAFFGSFVSVFVNRRIGSAERTLRFRSPLYLVP